MVKNTFEMRIYKHISPNLNITFISLFENLPNVLSYVINFGYMPYIMEQNDRQLYTLDYVLGTRYTFTHICTWKREILMDLFKK